MNCPRSKHQTGHHVVHVTKKTRVRALHGRRFAQGFAICSCGHAWWSTQPAAVPVPKRQPVGGVA
jgi:hypothetical protein